MNPYLGRESGFYDGMAPKMWDASTAQWKGSTDNRPDLEGALPVTPFDPYIAKGTVLTRDVRGSAMPLWERSSAAATWMDVNLNAGGHGGYGRTTLNNDYFGTVPIATYIVDSSSPHMTWQTMESARAGAGYSNKLVAEYCVGQIPMPSWAKPALDGDRGLAIYDVATGIMREYFYAIPGSGPGKWEAGTAGVSLAKPWFKDLPSTNYGMQLTTGSSAVVGMHNPLGFVGISELLQGQINHAIAFTCADMQIGVSWPGTGFDGGQTDPDAPRQGQWCRLPMSVDPKNDPKTGFPYKPITQILIRAFQRYGAFASDHNQFVHAFNGENGTQWQKIFGGPNPWYRHPTDPSLSGVLAKRYESFDVGDFPWHLTEWAPVDWGRPNPDWVLRRGQLAPWFGTP